MTQVAEIISDVTEPITEASEPLDENITRRQQVQVGQSYALHFYFLVHMAGYLLDILCFLLVTTAAVLNPLITSVLLDFNFLPL